ncbi:uncharacterized protein LOC133745213 isoform X2 [Rosa rugosa]|uniref:uncharacterized protein LOC133745213 isoform X2 n=1 Tax=Rosa rugosa TaxID=74645 RepID=UPI002B417458|nr:uncharacterized protein LOC133745213 isoform X2 [Rosa rugosa]
MQTEIGVGIHGVLLFITLIGKRTGEGGGGGGGGGGSDQQQRVSPLFEICNRHQSGQRLGEGMHVSLAAFCEEASFERAKKWVLELKSQGNPNMVMALAGNKADLGTRKAMKDVCLKYNRCQDFASS